MARHFADTFVDAPQVGFSIDTRFIVNTKPPANQRGQSTLRRWSLGRLTALYVDPEDPDADENEWLEKSALAMHGRPDHVVTLPEQKKLVFPESLETNADFRFADRKRPHPDQVVAQKGPEYHEVLIKELLSGMGFSKGCKGPHVMLVNIAPFVEDAGRAFLKLSMEPGEDWPLDRENFSYISFHTMKSHFDWAVRKTQDVLEDAWLANKFTAPGYKLDTNPPTVAEEDLARLGPKGKAAMGDLGKLEFEVLVKDGMQMKIADDQRRTWESAPETYQDAFNELDHEHTSKYLNILAGLTFLTPGASACTVPAVPDQVLDHGSSSAEPEQTQESLVELESLDDLNSSYEVRESCTTKVAGVTVYLTKDNRIWFYSTQDKTIPIRSVLGGLGTGKYVPKAEGVHGAPLPLPDDNTVVEIDAGDGTNPTVQTMLQALKWIEKQGRSTFKVSFLEISRNANGGYDYSHDNDGPQIFKLLNASELQALQAGGDGEKLETPAKRARKAKGNKDAEDDAKVQNVNASTFFGVKPELLPTQKLAIIFRYRVLVGKNLKIAKPYVIAKRPINLKAGRPQQAGLAGRCRACFQACALVRQGMQSHMARACRA